MSAALRTRLLIALGLLAAFAGGAGLTSALGETPVRNLGPSGTWIEL